MKTIQHTHFNTSCLFNICCIKLDVHHLSMLLTHESVMHAFVDILPLFVQKINTPIQVQTNLLKMVHLS